MALKAAMFDHSGVAQLVDCVLEGSRPLPLILVEPLTLVPTNLSRHESDYSSLWGDLIRFNASRNATAANTTGAYFVLYTRENLHHVWPGSDRRQSSAKGS